jgi:hypothetical protein
MRKLFSSKNGLSLVSKMMNGLLNHKNVMISTPKYLYNIYSYNQFFRHRFFLMALVTSVLMPNVYLD